eukprot:COSAG01_NODE_9888_length_2311_cov_1.971971_3_plen_45_part_00
MKRFGYDAQSLQPVKLFTKVKFSHTLQLSCSGGVALLAAMPPLH